MRSAIKLRPPLSCAKYPVDALYLIPLRRYTTLHRILYGSVSSLPFGCSAFSSRMLTRGAAKAMRSPLSPRPSLVTPLANNRRASPARHHISRRLEVARQHWLSDIRYGPVPFQLSKDANTYEQQRDSKCATALSRRLAGICRCSSGRMRHGTRRTALRFIAHLVSDIHHPLHAGFPEDRGGADLHVSLNVRKMNLQSI